MKLHKNFSGFFFFVLFCFYFSQVGQDGLNGLQLDISLSPSQLGSDTTPSGQVLVKYFSLRAGLVKTKRVLWYISKNFSFISSYHSSGGFFSNIYHENSAMLLGMMSLYCGVSSMTDSPKRFQVLDLSTLSLQQFISYNSVTMALFSVPVSGFNLCLCSSKQ